MKRIWSELIPMIEMRSDAMTVAISELHILESFQI